MRTPSRRGKRAPRTTPAKHSTSVKQPPASLLALVKEGVERFILKGAPISSLERAVRAAEASSANSSHPLTGRVFRRIVREAVRERLRRVTRLHRTRPGAKRKRRT